MTGLTERKWDNRDKGKGVIYFGSPGMWNVYETLSKQYIGRVGRLATGKGWVPRRVNGERVYGIPYKSRLSAARALLKIFEDEQPSMPDPFYK